MAKAVAQAVRDERPLVVQAGTGTGKTWAPVRYALLGRAKGKVVVATATKALQDQLAGKDLPAVAAVGLRPGLTWAVLKGRSNYLCRQAAVEQLGRAMLPLWASRATRGRRSAGRWPGWWPGPTTARPGIGPSWPSSPARRRGRR